MIIFDWDGTLINSIDWIIHCLQHAAAQYDCPIPEPQAAKDVIGLSIDRAMQTLFPDTDVPTQKQLVASYSQKYRSKQICKDDLFPGVYGMLEQLNEAGYKLAVATGKTRAGLQDALKATETEKQFRITRCADETASKPDPKMLHEIIQHTGSTKERTLMVGDSIHDLQMAHNAHISAIAVSCGAHSEEFLLQFNPLLCLQQPAELLNII